MAFDVMSAIAEATKRASTPKATTSKKPIFLFFANRQKALLRPVVALSDAIPFKVHNKWNDDRELRVNAICAKEIGKPCEHCEQAKKDKKLAASVVLFLPVYVHQVTDTETGEQLSHKEKDEEGNEIWKLTKGFRVLELPLYGKQFIVLQAFNSYVRDEDDHDIRVCDFSIEQQGTGTTKNFLITPKTPKPFNPEITKSAPSLDRFRQAILDARVPLVAMECVDVLAEDHYNRTNKPPVTPIDDSDFEVDENGIAVF